MNNLSKTKEDKLIAQAAAGDEKATASLYHHYEGLLIKESRERYLAAMNLSDEAPGIARLAFYEAIKSYDATRGIHFAAYLQRQVRGTLYTEFKRQRRYLARTIHPDQTATEEQNFWDVYADTSRSQNHEEKICHRELLRQAIHQLTPAEKRLLTLIYLYEIPQKQIASLLHITHQSITKAKKRLLTHLRQTISQPTPRLTCVYVL
ncbi:MAG: sigma-70 family RNA polymerase sigma factor [Selenomonas sp.]|uniref:RNA polymerase sigma factor n=1 Tax=Selenomonas sp. TaxID=2053611 RepID=UPI0025E7742E|nr:sigma-70 family RNA polymerase sigma factor [Selenomonas sp.]MCR5438553.1 sigma-70 family RNA polymerase sigma factor [Selenomonas sp.]